MRGEMDGLYESSARMAELCGQFGGALCGKVFPFRPEALIQDRSALCKTADSHNFGPEPLQFPVHILQFLENG